VLDDALQRHGRTLDPARKARAVLVIYNYFSKAKAGQKDEGFADQLLELMA